MYNIRLKNDLVNFWALILLSIIVVYFLPFIVNQIYFLIIFIIIIVKKKYNYFWVAFLFTLLDCPGHLFMADSMDSGRQLPFIRISGSARIDFFRLIPLLFLFKIYRSAYSRIIHIFRKDLIFFLVFFLYAFLLGIIYGTTANYILNAFYLILGWTLLFSLPKLLSFQSIENLDRLLFSVVIVAFISQLYTFITGIRWLDFFAIRNFYMSDSLQISGDNTARTIFSPIIILYSMIKALFYIFNKRKPSFSYLYLYVISFISILSIVLSAARGWILASLVLIFLMLITFGTIGNLKRIISIGTIGIILSLIVLLSIPRLQTQAEKSIQRFSSIENIAKGDFSRNSQASRITDRAPIMLKIISTNPFLGLGFSSAYWNNRDEHVGHLQVIMNVGILGFLVFTFFFIKWVFMMYSLANRNSVVRYKYGEGTKILSFGLIFIMIIHSTSRAFWGFDLDIASILVIALLFATYNDIATNSYT
jgi:hypothetical protein